MTDKRTLTVSVTINLGNYENLRLEVSDLAESAEDADSLRHYLASVLDGYGNNNAAAKTAIQKYKEHILEDCASESPKSDEFAETESGIADFSDDPFIPDVTDDVPENTLAETPSEPIDTQNEEPVESIAAEPVPMPPALPADVNISSSTLPPAPLVEEKNSEEYICSKCGAPVNKLQRDVSMLFNHKILCKNCMK